MGLSVIWAPDEEMRITASERLSGGEEF